MFGAIIGDIAGSYYEVNNIKTKKFKLMEKYKSTFTDDTVTTLVVAKSILECNNNYDALKDILIDNMVESIHDVVLVVVSLNGLLAMIMNHIIVMEMVQQ